MKGLEFALALAGFGYNDAAWNFQGYGFGTDNKKEGTHPWTTFPLQYVVIKHPEAGIIMYDVGLGMGEDTDRRPWEHRQMNPVTIDRSQYVDETLKKLGYSVDDVNAIIISHCHWDHIGGLEFFKGTKAIKNVYVPEKDFAYGLVHSHVNSIGYSDALYYRQNMDVEGADFKLLDEDIELFPGVELITLEGHSPCVLGLILHLESGNYIFPSDACTAQVCFSGEYLPGTIYDSLGYQRALKRLRKLQKELNAEMIFQHDPWSYKNYRYGEWIA